jgi:uroporphyrinogen-III synthase
MKVFITRPIRAESDFFRLLSASGIEVHGESLVEFQPVPFEEIPSVDWLFFYSQTGVRFFFRQAGPDLAPAIRLAALGKTTAEWLEKICRPPDFTGDGDPVGTAAAFLALARGQRVLFPRARESRQSIQQLLGDKIVAYDLVVYDNIPRSEFELPVFDALVFTSPLNVKAYFSQKKLLSSQKAFAIGNTTAAALEEAGVRDFVIAGAPSEEELAIVVLDTIEGKR